MVSGWHKEPSLAHPRANIVIYANMPPSADRSPSHPGLSRSLLVAALVVLVPMALFVGIGIGRRAHHLLAPSEHIISSTPVRIDRPGRYILTNDLDFASSTGAAIQIAASQVTIDLQGFSIRCTSDASDRLSIGIETDQQFGILIRNGTLDGFYAGVWLRDVSADGRYVPTFGQHRVEGLIVRNSTFRGIRVEGRACIIADNQIVDTGGSTAYPNAYSFGIEVIGPATTIRGNTIVDTVSTGGEAVGISISSNGMASIIENNIIYNTQQTPSRSIGVWIGGDSCATIVGNQITNFDWGIAGSSPTRWAYRDNCLMGCVVPVLFPGKTASDGDRWRDGGGNVAIPFTE